MSRTLTPADKTIIAKIQAAADKRRADDPLTGEDGDYIEALTHLAIREIHKLGGNRGVGAPAVRGNYVERTPEQQAKHDAAVRREGSRLGREAVGIKFAMGRKSGTKGPIRKAIARLLKKHPDMKNRELWNAIAAKPPKDCEFCNNSQGEYIDRPGGYTTYATFRNICAEERKIIVAASAHEARLE